MHCDVAKDADVERLGETALSTMGHVDILMNNAGVVLRGALELIPVADWEWSFSINLLGVVRGIRAFLPHMLERGSGYIINTGSVAGLIALTGEGAPYVASKFAVVGLSEALALYARPRGIGVSVLCPGSVDTNLLETERAIGITPEMALAEAASSAVFHSVLMTPDQIGEVVVEAVQQQRFFVLPDHHQQSIMKSSAFAPGSNTPISTAELSSARDTRRVEKPRRHATQPAMSAPATRNRQATAKSGGIVSPATSIPR